MFRIVVVIYISNKRVDCVLEMFDVVDVDVVVYIIVVSCLLL